VHFLRDIRIVSDILVCYESALGEKGLENDRERSWRWRERSRAFPQEPI